MRTPKPPQVFISYSHKDRKWLEMLQVFLKSLERDRIVERWDDTRIDPGGKWKADIKNAIESSSAAVLLISADFIASEFVVTDELPPLVSAAHDRGILILPILVSYCSIDQIKGLKEFQLMPLQGVVKPLVVMRRWERDKLFTRVAETIRLHGEKIGTRHRPFETTPKAPAINDLAKRGPVAFQPPSWEQEFARMVDEYDWRVNLAEIRVNRIRDLFRRISDNPKYKGPEKWSFRINWTALELDSYSDDTTCLRLFDALLQTDATQLEYKLIFNAINRVLETTPEPPRKLAASILFSGCSMGTLEGVKDKVGNYLYDTSHERNRALYLERVPDNPGSLLLPKNILINSNNYERFIASQILILSAVSKVCKYIQCSTVEVTVSHSFLLDIGPNENGSKLVAMSCTAARTNKESLAAISEVPVIIERGKKISWYGQLHKRPSSEYRQHWNYHNGKVTERVTKNLIVHFHPIALLDTFRKVRGHDGTEISEKDFIKGIARFFEESEIEFHVFTKYEFSSRSPDFGAFMRDRIKDNTDAYAVIWKPNHGIWVFIDDRNCTDDNLVDTCLALDNISQEAARHVCPEVHLI